MYCLLTGDPGQPGLAGLPGAYTVQIPHSIQKRDAGKRLKKLLNQIKMSNVTCESLLPHFFYALQTVKRLDIVKSVALKSGMVKVLLDHVRFHFTLTRLC